MLIDASITIAYKCSSCGSFEFFNTSLFMILRAKEHSWVCHCNKSRVNATKDGSGDYRIKIPCIGCGNEHIFLLSRRDMLDKEINVFCCPETGIQFCFIGKDKAVRKKIDSLEKELDEIIDAFGYDSYFVNTQVMFDSLNKIHDIAEQGNLYCECGNSDIELVLLPDKIYLKCKRCEGNKTVYAASNEDLKDILMRQQILLSGGFPIYETRGT